MAYPSGRIYFVVKPRRAKAAIRYAASQDGRAAPLIQPRKSDWLSRYFRAGDLYPASWFKCRCLRAWPILVIVLDLIVEAFAPYEVKLISAYRPGPYSRALGVPTNGPHRDGLAADITSSGASLLHLYRVAVKIVGQRGRVYLYRDHVHVEIDPEWKD